MQKLSPDHVLTNVNDGGKNMKRFTTFACFAMVLVFALSSFANELPKYHNALEITADATDFSKAARDTHYLLGGPTHNADYNGTFQNGSGSADWNGFTGIDYTLKTEVRFHVSTFEAINGVNSVWCGQDFGGGDVGYGNSWNELLGFWAVIGNPAVSTTVDITSTVNHNTEDGFDYSMLTYYKDGGAHDDLWNTDGSTLGEFGWSPITVAGTVTYLPGEYVNSNKVHLTFGLQSDGAWSSEDGLWGSPSGLWIDDVTVTVTNDGNVQTFTDDFETNLGNWAVEFPVSVGNFSKIWTNLEDFDPCLSNYGPQVAFIDDGLVVPGTGGSFCQEWCYGPGGYIVTTTGGLVGPEGHIENAVESPVMAWPNQDYNGCYYFFDAYRHEDLSADSPGIFYQWAIRSITTADPADMADAVWGDRNFVYYGGPDYIRAGDAEINNLIEPGRTFVQVRASVIEYGYNWSWDLNDGYPAPYFDNFRLLAFPFVGPGYSFRELDLANDNFPAIGTLDLVNLGANSVRFDMANTTDNTEGGAAIIPGDSLVISIAPVRDGAVIETMPVIHYTINANPLFDPYRTEPTTGSASGDWAIFTAGGIVDTNFEKYAFDLPDEGLLFPGDVLHYYIYVEDKIGGADMQFATIPADLDEYGDFSFPMKYNSSFTIHALPTVTQDGAIFSTPDVLFWNDFANRGGEDEWYLTFANLGLVQGVDYDIYYTNAPSSAVSNGIGGRATLDLLNNYSTMLYTCGDLSMSTMSNGDSDNDRGNDAGMIVDWLATAIDEDGLPETKNLYAGGDELASDLFQSGPVTLGLAENHMGLDLLGFDVRPYIGAQATPLVLRIGTSIENPVFKTVDNWIAYGGCPGINTFDAIQPTGDAVRLAEFSDPSGVAGAYPYSAATLMELNGNKVISMPYDFKDIWTNPNAAKAAASRPARTQVMMDILNFFGIASHLGDALPAPDAVAFSTRNFPNPFNPTTKIEFTMPREGHLSLKIFNVRGELVRTLVDGTVDAGNGFRMWDGTNEQGANVSSGVYFYEARTDSDVQVNKMALVK
jgi:hypothetical protein